MGRRQALLGSVVASCSLLCLLVAASLLYAADPPAGTYPYRVGQLTFPQDEGKHSVSEWPKTLMEWYAHYSHLKDEDGTRYLAFVTFVTFDPVESFLGGKFPHLIATLIDVTHAKTWHYRDLKPLKRFATGHADTATEAGDYFRWLGEGKPFCYQLRYGWRNQDIDVTLDSELRALKPPLAVNGTGYIKLPKGDSGYYSQTRLTTNGTLTLNGQAKQVSGTHWIDRQWLGVSCAQNMGYTYEWWSLQLDNNEEAILFRLFENKTNAVVMTHLEIVHADGAREHAPDVKLTDQPPGWTVAAPAAGWDLKITPACQGQQTWQSCDVTGTIRGQRITGVATAELARDIMKEYMKVIRPGG